MVRKFLRGVGGEGSRGVTFKSFTTCSAFVVATLCYYGRTLNHEDPQKQGLVCPSGPIPFWFYFRSQPSVDLIFLIFTILGILLEVALELAQSNFRAQATLTCLPLSNAFWQRICFWNSATYTPGFTNCKRLK